MGTLSDVLFGLALGSFVAMVISVIFTVLTIGYWEACIWGFKILIVSLILFAVFLGFADIIDDD